MKPMYERYKVMEQFIHYHKIIDAADLAKILMDENFFPEIVREAIEKCPALDLFGDEYDLKDKNKTPTWGDDDPYILEEDET